MTVREKEKNMSIEENKEEMMAAAAEEESSCCCCSGSCDEKADTEEVAAASESSNAPKKERKERPRVEITDKMLEDSAKTLNDMLKHLKLDATVKVEAGDNAIKLMVASEDAGRIIGKKGQTLESLQFLVNRMMQKDDQDYPRIFIDIDGYSTGGPRRDRRGSDRRDRIGNGRRPSGRDGARDNDDDRDFSPNAEILRQQASDAAKEVRRWGESVTLPAMSARDRRIIHITLENESDIQTESLGDGAKKRVVVSLKK